jgi:hypothetical protein
LSIEEFCPSRIGKEIKQFQGGIEEEIRQKLKGLGYISREGLKIEEVLFPKCL